MEEKAYNLERLNFLVVDNNKCLRILIRTILNALGARNFAEAADGAGAVKEPRHFNADIVIRGRNMESRGAGIHERIAEPISPKSLHARIRAIIERSRTFLRVKGPLGFFGPDRRRAFARGYLGAERRKSDKDNDGMEVNNAMVPPREETGAMPWG